MLICQKVASLLVLCKSTPHRIIPACWELVCFISCLPSFSGVMEGVQWRGLARHMCVSRLSEGQLCQFDIRSSEFVGISGL